MNPVHPHHTRFRTVTAYWDMAASFVAHGALKAEVFVASASEMLLMWVMIGRFAEEIRRDLACPGFLANVERTIGMIPDGAERLRVLGEANRKRRIIKEAREYLPSGWACSQRDRELILRDYEAYV